MKTVQIIPSSLHCRSLGPVIPSMLLYLILHLLFPLQLHAGQDRSMAVDVRPNRTTHIQLAQVQDDASIVPPDPDSPEWTSPSAAKPSPTPSASPSPPSTAGQGSMIQGQVSLNFDDADIYTVVQTIFANILRYNYVIDPRVKGRVTFRSIAPVARADVLPLMEVILRLNGIAIVEESGLYRIIPISEASREPSPVGYGRDPQGIKLSGKALLQVVPIRYLLSSEMVKLITPFVSANAVIVDVPKTNHIILVDTDSNVKRLLQLIDLFDNEQQKEKRPQVFLYHVQNTTAKEMASLLQQIFLGAKPPADQSPARTGIGPTTQAAGKTQATQAMPPSPTVMQTSPQMVGDAIVSTNTRIIPDEILNAVAIIATAEDYATIKQTIDKIDIVPRQVLFEGIIARVTLTDNLSLGMAWSLKMNMGILGTTMAFNPAALDAAQAKSGSGFTFWGIDPGGDVRALVTALAKEQRSKVLAAPHIMVADNREAKIQIGKQVPIVTSETYGTSTLASTPVRTIQYKDIGIILKVKPRIHEGGLVSVELYQEVSDYYTEKLGLDESTIILNKMDATSTLVAKDNQTIVIGGLIREDTAKSNNGIPFFNKIPILGYLFGNTEDNKERTEIIILLTPHVVKSRQEVEDITNKYISKQELLGGNIRQADPVAPVQKGNHKQAERNNAEPGTSGVNLPSRDIFN